MALDACQGRQQAGGTVIRDAVTARAITDLARETMLPREDIAATLAPGGQPDYETVVAVLHALGFQ